MDNLKVKIPDFSHISQNDLEYIYEPSEDTFLLIDAIENDLLFIKERKPSLCLEVGTGSGLVITALGMCLGSECCYITTDINPKACDIAVETGRRNGVKVKSICTDLVIGIQNEVKGLVDVLLFNPPYVVTPSEEVGRSDLEKTWAGGVRGREVMDRFFPIVDTLLSPRGVFYLLVIKENEPNDIEKVMKRYGFSCTVIVARKTGPENLSVLRFVRK